MESQTRRFKDNAREAMADGQLAQALTRLGQGFPLRRAEAIDRLPEFEALREAAKAIKDHTLAHLDLYLEQYEARVTEAGGQVHWCRTAQDARDRILEICRKVDARTVTKSKSMIGEEIAINDFLEENGVEPVETDLGEYIIQLRKEPPSHIIAPAVHLNKGQVEDTFRKAHTNLDPARDLDDPRSLLEEARNELRDKFLNADVGLTGANFLIAETGTNVLVTNEGNADLTYSLPRVHIVIASLEKVIPTLEDTATVLRVLARSGTGQDITVYTTFCTGPRRPADLDGPEEYHVVLLDNGRTELVGTEFQDMLRCIRCGSCLNHCPVYHAIGGHAYGWVYSGPMGAVLIPGLIGIHEAGDLPNASTLCGRCESVCPMRIPLPRMLRAWRERQFERKAGAATSRWGLRAWAWLVKRPRLYRAVTAPTMTVLALLGRRRGRFRWLPLAGGWTGPRDLPAPQGDSFIAQYHKGPVGAVVRGGNQ
ncbi:MAG: iron-sulfur cluster-binding protein [Rhodospirillales bacterium CG15_BIG_FIL_POST_REV_8_21_14_020_66_15]|nr:MAG: iron-sulfur cluster-binding protein [Rhodospirillales bacterium CG15_BIG_FIL_POST_REV_8_21_14_020_66_15]